jgi:hypothetical protein
MWDETMKEKDKTHAMCNILIQKLQQDATRLNKVVNLITTMEPYI